MCVSVMRHILPVFRNVIFFVTSVFLDSKTAALLGMKMFYCDCFFGEGKGLWGVGGSLLYGLVCV